MGAFLSLWVMGYGYVQVKTPQWLSSAWQSSDGAVEAVKLWSAVLFVVMLVLSYSAYWIGETTAQLVFAVLPGLLISGVFFAMGSSLHSYLIPALTTQERSTMDVGFLLYVERRRSTTGHFALRSKLSVGRAGAIHCVTVFFPLELEVSYKTC